MKNYRFTAQEIEQVKNSILTHIQYEDEGEKTAWRYRLALSAQAQCSRTKKTRDRYTRKLALYEQLTTNDLPNWLPTDQEAQYFDIFSKLYFEEKCEDGFSNTLFNMYICRIISEDAYKYIRANYNQLREKYKSNPYLVYYNGKPYTGVAYSIQGYNGYTSSKDHRCLVAEISGNLFNKNGNYLYLLDKNGDRIKTSTAGGKYTFKDGLRLTA